VPEALIAQLEGRWLSTDGGEFTVAARSGGLFVASGGIERPLSLRVPAWRRTTRRSSRTSSRVTKAQRPLLRVGSRLFGRGQAPAVPATSPRLAALAGSYFAPGAWSPYARIDAVGDKLFGGVAALREAPDGSWRFADPASAERIWFEDFVDGRPQTLNLSGTHYLRQSIS
jgi:hypothetical protein